MKFWSGMCFLLLITSNGYAALDFDALYANSRCERYIGATPAELLHAKTLFVRALKGERLDDPDYKQQWLDLKFDWMPVVIGEGRWWVAREYSTTCRGQGFYIFNEQHTSINLLQIPHRFNDSGTGRIASHWVRGNSMSAIAWNTTPRTTLDAAQNKADLAHRWDNYFVPLTQAYAEVYPAGRIIQLHGFSSDKRRTPAGRQASIIVSAGHSWPGNEARGLQTCLKAGLKGKVLLFPYEVKELGATRNVQGRFMRSLGHNGFVHLEFSNALRKRLKNNHGALDAIGQCLLQGDKE